MSEITVLQGEIHADERGSISSLNNLSFDGIRRTYILHHPNTSVLRGWHAHRYERKWYYCHKGSFHLWLVKIDDWDNPSHDLPVERFELAEDNSQIVIVPAGYGSLIQACEPDSIMQVFSDVAFPECLKDSWRFEPEYFAIDQ
jgi:dTDP-4-dehydrorhamnose 3,5-epimerase-like enzyme